MAAELGRVDVDAMLAEISGTEFHEWLYFLSQRYSTEEQKPRPQMMKPEHFMKRLQGMR